MAQIIVNNIKLPISHSEQEAIDIARARISRAFNSSAPLNFRIHKRSIDARKKEEISFVWSVIAEGDFPEISDAEMAKHSIVKGSYAEPEFKIGKTPLTDRPVIIGAGPCGLFAALVLAEAGYNPIVIERGGDIAARRRAVDSFVRNQILDESTNIQYGLGGAGTFSDGKLITRINDSFGGYILRRLAEFGAPTEILYNAKPHIGTDILADVVTNIAERIISLGGEIRFNTKFLSCDLQNSRISQIKTDNGELTAGAIIMAIGHSSRDTYNYLINSGISLEAKNFSVGMRIEHLASDIDEAMYGSYAHSGLLPHAEYTLSHNTKVRGAYTFCMCPGGEVVAAASEYGGVVVNGMSNSRRDGKNSNCALVVSVFREDYGKTPAAAIEFQRKIEHSAFIAGGSDYTAPAITVGDFLDGKLGADFSRVAPTYMNGRVKHARPEAYLPDFVCDGMKGAILDFDRKIKGFASPSAVLTGAETRTSAPIRILRDKQSSLALGYSNLYPAGEGAGYAGGITSAAIDGLRCALSLMRSYAPAKHH